MACLIHKLVGASFQEVDDSCDQEAVLVGIGSDIRTDYHNFKERVVDFFFRDLFSCSLFSESIISNADCI